MRISMWQQFGSNHSSSFTVVGVFETPEAAQRAAIEIQQIVAILAAWYDEHPEEAIEILSSGTQIPSPAEIEMGKRFGFEWPYPVEWYGDASVKVELDRLVYLTTKGFRPDTPGEPFEQVMSALGGQGLLDANAYGDQIGTILVDITCVAPDAETARVIAEEKLEFRCMVRNAGSILRFYDWPFTELDLPTFIEQLRDQGCTDIQYRLWQSEDPGGKRPDPQDVDLLIKLVQRPASDREYIIRALGDIGDPRAVEPLITALRNTDRWIRGFAAYALGQIGDGRAVEPLLILLNDKDDWVRYRTLVALDMLGDPRAIPALVDLLRNDQSWQQAANMLGKMGEPARNSLNAVLQDPKIGDRARHAITRVNDSLEYGPLLSALRSANPEVRLRALEVLQFDHNIEVLLAYVRNPGDSAILDSVFTALADLGDPRAIDPLTELVPSMLRHSHLIEALIKLGVPPVEPLIEVFRNEQLEYWIREHALWWLTQIADPRTDHLFVEVLVSLWHPYNPSINLANIIQLLKRHSAIEPAVARLIALLPEKDTGKRVQIIYRLGELGDPRAIEPLRALEGDTDMETRFAIQTALAKLG
jgi:HEAT repeat protein